MDKAETKPPKGPKYQVLAAKIGVEAKKKQKITNQQRGQQLTACRMKKRGFRLIIFHLFIVLATPRVEQHLDFSSREPIALRSTSAKEDTRQAESAVDQIKQHVDEIDV
jgi:hypothetical protein